MLSDSDDVLRIECGRVGQDLEIVLGPDEHSRPGILDEIVEQASSRLRVKRDVDHLGRVRTQPGPDLWVPKTCATWPDAPLTADRWRFAPASGTCQTGLGLPGRGMILNPSRHRVEGFVLLGFSYARQLHDLRGHHRSDVVQHASTATLSAITDLIRPMQARHLHQRPTMTAMPLVHTEEVTGSIPVSPTRSEAMSILAGIAVGAIPVAKRSANLYAAAHDGQALSCLIQSELGVVELSH